MHLLTSKDTRRSIAALCVSTKARELLVEVVGKELRVQHRNADLLTQDLQLLKKDKVRVHMRNGLGLCHIRQRRVLRRDGERHKRQLLRRGSVFEPDTNF